MILLAWMSSTNRSVRTRCSNARDKHYRILWILSIDQGGYIEIQAKQDMMNLIYSFYRTCCCMMKLRKHVFLQENVLGRLQYNE